MTTGTTLTNQKPRIPGMTGDDKALLLSKIIGVEHINQAASDGAVVIVFVGEKTTIDGASAWGYQVRCAYVVLSAAFGGGHSATVALQHKGVTILDAGATQAIPEATTPGEKIPLVLTAAFLASPGIEGTLGTQIVLVGGGAEVLKVVIEIEPRR